ncbi:hypothetical protein F8M41_000550 [Gigaspora margarita]|uniref:Uncharacterized protein n=1 Tax=Gigaspora margarita TaxID=4874 RepID=A0A8H4AZF8_GIGMA|nr:hypothetical protein F8M41_000550 [Gigaspora margarita]
MHTYSNILPYFVNIFDDDEWQLECGKNSLVNSSERRYLDRDPQSHARIGQKCDLVITSNKLCWFPELLIGEVSGGILPQCSAHKAWEDKIRLGIGLRDVLVRLENELPGINQAVYGVQVVGYKLKVYAMVSREGLFHLMLLYECYLPATLYEIYYIENIWNVLNTLHSKVRLLEMNILNLNRKKYNDRKRNLENQPIATVQPVVIGTPITKKGR